MVKYLLMWNLIFPYNYVHEIKLKVIKTVDVIEARHSFYPRSICILKTEKQIKTF